MKSTIDMTHLKQLKSHQQKFNQFVDQESKLSFIKIKKQNRKYFESVFKLFNNKDYGPHTIKTLPPCYSGTLINLDESSFEDQEEEEGPSIQFVSEHVLDWSNYEFSKDFYRQDKDINLLIQNINFSQDIKYLIKYLNNFQKLNITEQNVRIYLYQNQICLFIHLQDLNQSTSLVQKLLTNNKNWEFIFGTEYQVYRLFLKNKKNVKIILRNIPPDGTTLCYEEKQYRTEIPSLLKKQYCDIIHVENNQIAENLIIEYSNKIHKDYTIKINYHPQQIIDRTENSDKSVFKTFLKDENLTQKYKNYQSAKIKKMQENLKLKLSNFQKNSDKQLNSLSKSSPQQQPTIQNIFPLNPPFDFQNIPQAKNISLPQQLPINQLYNPQQQITQTQNLLPQFIQPPPIIQNLQPNFQQNLQQNSFNNLQQKNPINLNQSLQQNLLPNFQQNLQKNIQQNLNQNLIPNLPQNLGSMMPGYGQMGYNSTGQMIPPMNWYQPPQIQKEPSKLDQYVMDYEKEQDELDKAELTDFEPQKKVQVDLDVTSKRLKRLQNLDKMMQEEENQKKVKM